MTTLQEVVNFFMSLRHPVPCATLGRGGCCGGKDDRPAIRGWCRGKDDKYCTCAACLSDAGCIAPAGVRGDLGWAKTEDVVAAHARGRPHHLAECEPARQTGLKDSATARARIGSGLVHALSLDCRVGPSGRALGLREAMPPRRPTIFQRNAPGAYLL